MNDNLMGSLECGICMDMAKNAVETTCCHHIFCAICLAQVKSHRCPTCQKVDVRGIESHLARRLINETSVTCEFCQLDVKRGNLSDHQMLCPCRIITCPAPDCTHSSLRDEFIQHIASSHGDNLIKNAAALFLTDAATLTQGYGADRIGTKINAIGKTAKLGKNGKYYCGEFWSECDSCGQCGPTPGFNCKACMKLDLEARLLPSGYLVNNEGAAARKCDFGSYYCGRKTMIANRHCDGYCGPNEGPNCEACKMLDKEATSRYHNLS